MRDKTPTPDPARSGPPADGGPGALVRLVQRTGQAGAVALLTLLAMGLAAAIAASSAAALGVAPWPATQVGVLCALFVAPLALWPWLGLVRRHEQLRLRGARSAGLTEGAGWADRRQFLEMADREWSRSRRYDEDGALLLIDADHFASVTQARGRACADALLVQVARVARATLRHPDLLARFGDEGVAVYLPHTDPLGALDVAERIRERVAATGIGWDGAEVSTTVSIGVASIGGNHAALDGLIADAGRALHAAKEAGRNCVRAAPIQPRRSGESRSTVSR